MYKANIPRSGSISNYFLTVEQLNTKPILACEIIS